MLRRLPHPRPVARLARRLAIGPLVSLALLGACSSQTNTADSGVDRSPATTTTLRDVPTDYDLDDAPEVEDFCGAMSQLDAFFELEDNPILRGDASDPTRSAQLMNDVIGTLDQAVDLVPGDAPDDAVEQLTTSRKAFRNFDAALRPFGYDVLVLVSDGTDADRAALFQFQDAQGNGDELLRYAESECDVDLRTNRVADPAGGDTTGEDSDSDDADPDEASQDDGDSDDQPGTNS